MAGTIIGGKKAAKTNKQRYGEDFYHEIGRMGGLKSTGGGFAADPELARRAGRLGGLRSRRPRIYAAQILKFLHSYLPENYANEWWATKLMEYANPDYEEYIEVHSSIKVTRGKISIIEVLDGELQAEKEQATNQVLHVYILALVG